MEYTVQKLAQLAGITSRTLRWYDRMGLLQPARVSSSGYRIYGREEVDRLQQILFYRELGVSLEEIRVMLHAPAFDGTAALRIHRERLIERRLQLDRLIENVDRSLATAEGRGTMTDRERFEGFKKEMVEHNERRYGVEIRKAYGEETVERANRHVEGMSKVEMDKNNQMDEELLAALREAVGSETPQSEEGQRIAGMHKAWLTSWWGGYDPEAHIGLVRMYVEDERFRVHYDKDCPGAAEFLRDAVEAYVEKLQGEP